MQRISGTVRRKGWFLFRNDRVKKEFESSQRIFFKVKGETEEHSVIFDKVKKEWSCDCKYWSLKLRWCSHIYAAWLWLRNKSRK